MRVAVTGVSGYIGGEILIKLKDQGHSVLGVDYNAMPLHLRQYPDQFIQRSFEYSATIADIIDFKPDAIIHCAGTSLVGPSINNPAVYYRNNVANTLQLLSINVDLPKCRIIFSSSAAAYGLPVILPCQEEDPTDPISPYGQSKVMVEQMLESYHRAYGLDYVAFRFFNAAGADHLARHGQTSDATHIIPRLVAGFRNQQEFVCNGNDYNTPDGTCIRDYVHVEDIAQAHILALNAAVPSGIYNLGSEQGASNLEVIKLFEEVSGQKLNLTFGPRREGDPDELVASFEKFHQVSGWSPKYSLREIIEHAWAWHNRSIF